MIQSYQEKVQVFQKDAQARLFDIAACKCKDFKNCKCDKERRVPQMELEFLLDQKTKRKMVIGSLDAATTKRYVKWLSRKQTILGPSSRKAFCEIELYCSTSSASEGSGGDFVTLLHNFQLEQNGSWKESARKKACNLSLLHVIVVYYLTQLLLLWQVLL